MARRGKDTTVFDDILLRGIRKGQIPAREKAAREWYRNAARRTVSAKQFPAKLVQQQQKKPTIGPGRMFLFKYNPKHRRTLPYYDVYPVIFMVGFAKGGFHGINLHYLPPRMRAALMDELYGVVNNKRYDASTKLKISYKILKNASRFRYFRPCFKHYLASHIASKLIEVPITDWDIALFLRNERFIKAPQKEVWKDSRKIIKKYS